MMKSVTDSFRDHAASYDKQWEKLAPMRDGLYFLIRMVLSVLSPDAKVLCVGAGTGAELIALAQAFPNWTFTAVDPSAAMLDVCRKNVERAGLSSRCQFHEGYLDTLAHADKFNAATSLMVSQFLPDEDQRRSFFRAILCRLLPGAYFINADLTSPVDPSVYENLMDTWVQVLMFTGLSRDTARTTTSRWGKDVAVSKPKEIESLIATSGFVNPTLFYQSLFIHAWYANVPKLD